jgi:uroporphyrin-III C-methyltransferase/precorrin-2 dehydrogenase/sirohydrochlorin ferrochelatase
VRHPYPLHLDLTGKRVLVVGAGPVAVRRARAAAAAGGIVDVVALQGPDDLGLPIARRAFTPSDVDGAWLVLSCTGTVDAEVAEACRVRGVWCVRSDDARTSDAWVPAVGRVEDVVVSVTSGRDPRRSKALRDRFVEELP